MKTMMKATLISRYGAPDVFDTRDVERPEPFAGEVLEWAVCSGANPVVAKLRQDGIWAGLISPVVLGYDVSEVVEQTGPNVAGLKTGYGCGKIVLRTASRP